MTTNGNSTLTQKDVAQESAPERLREGVTFTPRVDILETDKELILKADLPGVRNEDVELRFEKGQLILTGHVKQADGGDRQFLLQEYGEGDFYRAFAIHESIDASKIEASCKQGVLTVHLPKVEAVKPRQIAVKAQ
jgi:HSP20 family protein